MAPRIPSTMEFSSTSKVSENKNPLEDVNKLPKRFYDVLYDRPEIIKPRSRTSSRNQPQVGHPATTTGVPGTAIDSKIEQAMDLVKTHLMYAVREEIEQLRNRIMDLETTVIQLEAENSILREHVPADILKNLNLSSTQPTAVAQ